MRNKKPNVGKVGDPQAYRCQGGPFANKWLWLRYRGCTLSFRVGRWCGYYLLHWGTGLMMWHDVQPPQPIMLTAQGLNTHEIFSGEILKKIIQDTYQ